MRNDAKPSVDEVTKNWMDQPKNLAKEFVNKYANQMRSVPT